MDQTDQDLQADQPVATSKSPPWSRTTKIVIVVISLLLIALAAQRFRSLIAMVVVAAIIAYILNPLIKFLDERTKLSRGWMILVVYLLLAGAVGWLSFALGVAAYDQISELIVRVPNIIDSTIDLIERAGQPAEPIIILDRIIIDPVQLPWGSITDQILGFIEPTLSTSGSVISQLAATTVRTVGNFIFVIVISIYLSIEIPNVGKYIDRIAAQPGYEDDARIIGSETGKIWGAFLRGQVILGVVIFLVVWLGLSIIGVQNALALGLLAGLLEFIPTIGPIISTVVAMAVAFFQPSNPWGLEGWQFALIVLGFMLVVQQVENNALVPRIVGRALDLHPLLVIVGVLMGASLAGILGAILAAPVLATVKLIGTYIWRKLFDLPPFPAPSRSDIPPPDDEGDAPEIPPPSELEDL